MKVDEHTLAQRIASAGLDWIVPRWPAPLAVRALVTTRNGGVDGSLDLGGSLEPMDARETAAIAENRRRVQKFLPAAPAWLVQVHGADVVSLDAAPANPPRADAAVTRAANVVLAVRMADCLPVLFADRDARVVAAAHAGWRGLAAGVLENTVRTMQSDPASVVAWLGPAIGASAFEVGDDVRDAFVCHDAAAARAFVATVPGKWLADLDTLARMRLVRAGVRSIYGGGVCTFSDPARFFSFRRDRTGARMAAFVWREPG